MKRTKTSSNPTAIITSDIELRAYAPLCRTDDHWAAQEKKIKWLRNLQEKYGCPILDGGDLFDKKYKQHPSHNLIAWAIQNLPRPIYTVPGNHDLPGKTMDNYENSAMYVLEQARIICPHKRTYGDKNSSSTLYIHRIPWGEPLKGIPEDDENIFDTFSFKVVLIHEMIYDGTKPFPGCEGYEKEEILDMFSNFDLIVCGHHHATFTGKRGKTILVNPGSLMRNEADQADLQPHVFLWYAEENRIEAVPVPITPGVVSRDHLDQQVKKEERLNAFIECLGQQAVKGINFEKNLELLLTKGMNQGIIKKVWQYYESKG